MILEGLRDCHWCCFVLIMRNYQLEVYVISMEFLAVNRRGLSRETPAPRGPGAMRGGCIRRLPMCERAVLRFPWKYFYWREISLVLTPYFWILLM